MSCFPAIFFLRMLSIEINSLFLQSYFLGKRAIDDAAVQAVFASIKEK